MKNQPFLNRLNFALLGIRHAFRSESSFKTQTVFAVGAMGSLFVLRPSPLWWAMVALNIAAVLGAELLNTALESVIDHLHPEKHPAIQAAKDCAAGAVLVFSASSLITVTALLYEYH